MYFAADTQNGNTLLTYVCEILPQDAFSVNRVPRAFCYKFRAKIAWFLLVLWVDVARCALYNSDMNDSDVTVVSLLNEILDTKHCLPSELAVSIGISHASVSRWLSGKDVPSPVSCRRLSEFSGICLRRILAAAGHMPAMTDQTAAAWPAFREYAQRKYPGKLDDDLITMIENIIESRPGSNDVPHREP